MRVLQKPKSTLGKWCTSLFSYDSQHFHTITNTQYTKLISFFQPLVLGFVEDAQQEHVREAHSEMAKLRMEKTWQRRDCWEGRTFSTEMYAVTISQE